MGWFSADISTMRDLFLHGLQDIYYAEHQIEKSLPDMIKKASDAQLKKGFQMHLRQTKGQIKRLDRAFKLLKEKPKGTKCPAIDDKVVLNAALIAAAQAVEHYEITRYGTLTAWAKAMGHSSVAKLLHANLNEEKATDKKLNTLAKTKVNRKAIARKPKQPTRAEREAMMQATVGIPAI
jgi:ferritin-like metal-binding protein YciE